MNRVFYRWSKALYMSIYILKIEHSKVSYMSDYIQRSESIVVPLIVKKLKKYGENMRFTIPKHLTDSETGFSDLAKGVSVVVTMTPMPLKQYERPIRFVKQISNVGGSLSVTIPKDIVKDCNLQEEERPFDVSLELIF